MQVVTRTPCMYTHVYCSLTCARLAKTVARAGIGTDPTRSNHGSRITTKGYVRAATAAASIYFARSSAINARTLEQWAIHRVY